MNATTKKKGFYTKYIQPHMGASIFVLILSLGIGFYLDGEREKDAGIIKHDSIEQRIPESIKVFSEWEDHMNEVPSDIDNFIREKRNIAIGDTLMLQQVKLDIQQITITEQLKVIDSFFNFAKNKKLTDSISEITKQISRDKRTDDMEVQKAATLLILQKLNELTPANGSEH